MKSVLLSAILLGAATLTAQTAPAPQAPADHPLARHYRDGESLTYRMTASNDDWHYTVLATSVVKKNPDHLHRKCSMVRHDFQRRGRDAGARQR
jgi:hypothetical protein